jgi:hypothetical protein
MNAKMPELKRAFELAGFTDVRATSRKLCTATGHGGAGTAWAAPANRPTPKAANPRPCTNEERRIAPRNGAKPANVKPTLLR